MKIINRLGSLGGFFIGANNELRTFISDYKEMRELTELWSIVMRIISVIRELTYERDNLPDKKCLLKRHRHIIGILSDALHNIDLVLMHQDREETMTFLRRIKCIMMDDPQLKNYFTPFFFSTLERLAG